MKKRNKIELWIKISYIPCSIFLVLILLQFHYPYTVLSTYEIVANFFDIDPLAIFRGNGNIEPVDFTNF